MRNGILLGNIEEFMEKLKTNTYALILAGGEGTRFAPLSSPDCPKQFLTLVGDASLIRQTADRVRLLIPHTHWWVATNARYLSLVHEHLPEIPAAHLIGETCKKNTAPAIALAASCLHRQNPDAIMVVVPSDHVVTDEAGFRNTLQQAISYAAQHDALVTLGMTPTWSSSDYGYIERGMAEEPGVFRVRRFVEKPANDIARSYVKAGTYSWNSGMFVWRTSVILDDIRRYLPDVYRLLQQVEWQGSHLAPQAVQNYFETVESVSIDYGIMETSDRAVVIPASFGWSDVGTWDGLKQLADSGVVRVPSHVRKLITQYARLR